MQSLLNELPGKGQLTSLLDGKFTPSAVGADGMREINAGAIKDDLAAATPDGGSPAVSLPVMPQGLTKEGFTGRINAPLDQLGGVNRNTLIGDVTSKPLPINLPAPTFDVNGTMGKITNAVIPVQVDTPTTTPDLPWLDVDSFTAPLRKLADAGASTPMRILGMLLKIVESFKNTLTDPSKMTELTTEALAEIYVVQLRTLRHNLPLHSLTATNTLLSSGYLKSYQQALDALEKNQDIDAFQKLGRSTLLSGLSQIQQSDKTLQRMLAKDVAQLQQALTQVLDFGAADDVFLQAYFDQLTARTGQVLGTITSPIKELTAMANDIVKYLEAAAKKAEEAARNVSTAIETNIQSVSGVLNGLQTQITNVTAEIEAFLSQVDVGPVVRQIKDGCNRISSVIEQFFVRIEELKIKLDAAVKNVQDNVDAKLTQTFNTLEQQIRQLLGKISEVLNRPDVQDALNKARQGIEDFKTKIGDASLKPVFDLVIEQTTKLEGNVRAIDVASMGTPQKTALKVGAKVIEAVKVDEIVKPELLDAFRQIREPLQELVNLLKNQVLVIERMIDEFNPGTIATDAILNSAPYQLVIKTLEEFKPSELLAPLKDANAELAKLVAKLDPEIILNELQRLYDQLYSLVETLSPESLNQLINKAINAASKELTNIRDYEIDSLLSTIKSAVSLEKLLAKTGLQDLADAEFWTMLKKVLGGDYLDEVSAAMDSIEASLRANAATLTFPSVADEIAKTREAFQLELGVTSTNLDAAATTLSQTIAAAAAEIEGLQVRRRKLMQTYDLSTGTGLMLRDLDLAPLTALSSTLGLVTGSTKTALNSCIGVYKPVIKAEESRIIALNESVLQNVVAAMFKRQFGDPVRKFVTDVKVQLQPFKDAITAIQKILTTVTKLPAQIDAAVANVLDTLGRSIKQVITDILALIETIRTSLISVIKTTYETVKRSVEAFSPMWLLNSVSASDFAGQGLMTLVLRIRNPSGDRLAALVQTKLTAAALELLQNQAAGSLSEVNATNVLQAINDTLRDATISTQATVDLVTQQLSSAIGLIEAKPAETRSASEMQQLYRYLALKGQLGRAWYELSRTPTNQNRLIRFNRVLFEASYPSDLGMSLQSLHPFIVEEIAHLYPEETVKRLDVIYKIIIDKIKGLPDQLIRRPLDDEFNKIKQILHKTFDIEGLFNVIDIKLAGLDGDLEKGLDRLSDAYGQLLNTLDERLAG